MTGTQIFNLVWLIVWLTGVVACLCGVIAGNWLHAIFVAFGLYFAFLLFFDREDGESLYQFFTRKIKAHKGGK